MKIKVISVRLLSLVKISDKAYKATAFNGSTAIIPISHVFGYDYDVQKSEAYWISAWILEKKELQYSNKKTAWLDKDTGRIFPNIQYEYHIPNKVDKIKIEHDKSLFK